MIHVGNEGAYDLFFLDCFSQTRILKQFFLYFIIYSGLLCD